MKSPLILFIFIAAVVSVVALVVECEITAYEKSPHYDEMVIAAETMVRAEELVRDARRNVGIEIDRLHDLNQSGLIGVENSETTTSPGNLEAKRTSANPDMAAMMVHLFYEAGVEKGDAIAVGASGSFPSLTLAALSAARTLDLDVALIVSLGASSWGANIPEFSYLKMHEAAYSALGYDILAASLGGGNDSGGDMTEEGRFILTSEIAHSGLHVIEEKNTAASVERRMAYYNVFIMKRRYSAFVNIGGASANVGDGLTFLDLNPGVNDTVPALPNGDCGVIYEMGSMEIPIIHLLNISRLTMDNGVPWDPVPFPEIGTSRIYWTYNKVIYRKRLTILSIVYFGLLSALFFLYRKFR